MLSNISQQYRIFSRVVHQSIKHFRENEEEYNYVHVLQHTDVKLSRVRKTLGLINIWLQHVHYELLTCRSKLTICRVLLVSRCLITFMDLSILPIARYGSTFTVHIAALMHTLFCTIAVARAFDWTLQFDWWLDQLKWQNLTGIVIRN